MNRRGFLWRGLAGSAIALGASGMIGLGGGGILLDRRSKARASMTSRMLDDALPPLSSNALRELNTLPVRAREEIRRYFHGKCLNVEGFVSHICSDPFAELLGRCQTQKERENCFLQAFCARVAGESEILNRVEMIAAETGSELDSGWDAYCTDLRARWNIRIRGYGSPLAMDELTNRIGLMIRTELEQAAKESVSTYQRPAVGQTIGKIGESAVLLLPMADVSVAAAGPAIGVTGNPLLIPVFFILAARHVWEYIAGRLDDRRGEFQTAISSRMALLGNRAGAEFEREVRQRLSDLHTWQQNSIRATASRLAEERVGLL